MKIQQPFLLFSAAGVPVRERLLRHVDEVSKYSIDEVGDDRDRDDVAQDGLHKLNGLPLRLFEEELCWVEELVLARWASVETVARVCIEAGLVHGVPAAHHRQRIPTTSHSFI